MQTINIEWRHLDVDGNTCERCGETGHEVRRAVDALNRECSTAGTQFTLIETVLAADALDESNAILIDGQYLDDLLPQAERSDSECRSCGDLIGEAVACRTVVFNGQSHETVPAEMIRSAACKVAACCTSSRCC